jgi:hypothetical protein
MNRPNTRARVYTRRVLNILRVGGVVGVLLATACATAPKSAPESDVFVCGMVWTPPPRGFFCSTSETTPAAGFCTREKADCQRARDASLAAIPDLAECQVGEPTAFCFTTDDGEERCAPTMTGCVPEVTARGITPVCDERR